MAWSGGHAHGCYVPVVSWVWVSAEAAVVLRVLHEQVR
jgi:hypothetical protein